MRPEPSILCDHVIVFLIIHLRQLHEFHSAVRTHTYLHTHRSTMLSVAKDSLKKSQNFHLYKKSFSYVSSLSSNFIERTNIEVQNQKLSIPNGSMHMKHNSSYYTANKRDVSFAEKFSNQTTVSSHSNQSKNYRQLGTKDVEQSTNDMLFNSFLKTQLVDTHGTLLPKTMRHLNSIHLQMFHDSFENYSKSSSPMLNGTNTIDRHQPWVLPASREPTREEYYVGNERMSTSLLTNSMKSPFMTHSHAFHTSPPSPVYINTVNSVSFNGQMDNSSHQPNSYAQREENNFDYATRQNTLEQNEAFNDFGNQCENDYVPTENNASMKIDRSTGRRHFRRQNPTEDSSTVETEAFNHEKMEKLFPDPRIIMNKVFMIVSTEFKDAKYMARASFEAIEVTKKSRLWQCTYTILWPEEISFTATARAKPAAANSAALKCLHYLHVNKKIKNGAPVLYASDEVKDIMNKPVKIEINPQIMDEVDRLLDHYNKDIVQLLWNQQSAVDRISEGEINVIDGREDIYEGAAASLSSVHELMPPSNRLTDPLRGTPLMEYSSIVLNQRDVDMYHNLRERRMNPEINLPIMEYRQDIINHLENERVLVVKGEPGCGKSTQLPQFILDHFTEKGKGTDCNIIITQPRRISAISLAERVADERNEELGKSIGYQVRLQSVLPSGPSGGILFCSTGILLRRLQSNPNLIGCSHVILDEAHERDLNTDILIVLLNRALQRNPNLKMVIMSATMNAGLFERYFNSSTISVPGFTYPVKMHFMEDILRLGIRGITEHDMSVENPSTNTEQMARLVQWISQTKPHGAILCFLPGWSEILKLKRLLEEILPSRSHIVLPVHSRLPHSDQALIFDRAPQGVRKIILATNIAETSITIDDVVYVVDSCAHKEVRLQHDTGRSSIDNQWVSQGNISQRKGRAGRVQPGESFHLITREKYRTLDEFPTPEIMRSELQKAVLDCKTYTSEKAAAFFAQMPEPPRESAVELAVTDLIEIGALNTNENLTALGKRIALFPIDPRLSKALVYSTIFECVNPMITMTSILSSEFEIFSDRMYDKSPIRKLKQQFDPASDHLALAWIFEQWNDYNNKSNRDAYLFCREAQLQFGRMMTLKDLRTLYAQHLSQSRMLDSYEPWENLTSPMNRYSNCDELVRGVLLAGLDRVLQNKTGEFKNGRFKKVKNVMQMQDGHRATLTPDSVNYNRDNWSSPYLTYQRHIHSSERRTTLIRETSLVSPLTVLLFCSGQVDARNYRKNGVETNDVLLTFPGKRNVRLLCDPETAERLLDLRDSMQNVTRYFVENQGLRYDGQTMPVIQSFKKQMIDLLTKMLTESNGQTNHSEEISSDAEDEW